MFCFLHYFVEIGGGELLTLFGVVGVLESMEAFIILSVSNFLFFSTPVTSFLVPPPPPPTIVTAIAIVFWRFHFLAVSLSDGFGLCRFCCYMTVLACGGLNS